MPCEFCREPMDAAAVVCPHCRREPSAIVVGRRKRVRQLATVLIVFVGLVLAAMIATGSGPEKPIRDRIKDSCDQQFGAGTEDATRCFVALALKQIQDDGDRRMEAARKGAGL